MQILWAREHAMAQSVVFESDGKRYFYVNPLEVQPRYYFGIWIRHILQTSGWYECACCPTNLVRLMTSFLLMLGVRKR